MFFSLNICPQINALKQNEKIIAEHDHGGATFPLIIISDFLRQIYNFPSVVLTKSTKNEDYMRNSTAVVALSSFRSCFDVFYR